MLEKIVMDAIICKIAGTCICLKIAMIVFIVLFLVNILKLNRRHMIP